MQDYGMDNNYIRFDLEDLKSLKKHVWVLGLLVVSIAVILFVLFKTWGNDQSVNDYQVLIMTCFLYAFPIAILFFLKYLVKWGTCYNYLAKLKKRKMLLPEKKEDYHVNLEELVTKETRELENEQGSDVLRIACSVAALIGFGVWVANMNNLYPASHGVIILAAPVLLFWIGYVIYTALRFPEEKFKDETNPDPTRRPKNSFTSYLVRTASFVVASFIWVSGVESLASFDEHDSRSSDLKYLSQMRAAAFCALHNLSDEAPEPILIVFEKDGYRIGNLSKGMTDHGMQNFMGEFMALMDMETVSLDVVNEKLCSRAYGTLDSLEFTVDARAGSVELVAMPHGKDAEPVVITE